MAKKKSVKKSIKAKKSPTKKAAIKKKAAVKSMRATGKTQISISLPNYLVEKVDRLAAKDNRNRSNFICTVLENI